MLRRHVRIEQIACHEQNVSVSVFGRVGERAEGEKAIMVHTFHETRVGQHAQLNDHQTVRVLQHERYAHELIRVNQKLEHVNVISQ